MGVKKYYIQCDICKKDSLLSITLSPDEIFYIRLEALNLNDINKTEFFNKDLNPIKGLRKKIVKKFGCNEWNYIIEKSFQIGILKYSDYVSDVIKINTTEIVYSFFDIIYDKKLSKIDIEENLFYLLNNYSIFCKEKLLSLNKKKRNKLSIKEIKILNNLMNNSFSEESSEFFELENDTEIDVLKIKLEVNNRFNLLRSAYALGCLNDEKFGDIKKKVILRYIDYFFELRLLDRNQVDCKILIWSLLIDFIFELELSYIF